MVMNSFCGFFGIAVETYGNLVQLIVGDTAVIVGVFPLVTVTRNDLARQRVSGGCRWRRIGCR